MSGLLPDVFKIPTLTQLEIDINSAPLSRDDLEKLRAEAIFIKHEADRITHRLKVVTGFVLLVVIGYLIVLFPFGYVHETLITGLCILVTGTCMYLLFLVIDEKGYLSNFWANHRLHELDQLNAVTMPDECIAYETFRNDSDVERFHRQILAQGRMPVWAEYKAALDWVNSSEKRKSALAAFEKMGTVR